ncbi:tyrosine-type recombinase/integrase [Paraburkholderia sp. MM5477-R1]|uniref:tyrosine-type recombinase/integrase n=1 Tax=Paraburkholderia sp. MM5477-R1 TaxID=2991062 RepID=UPI003D251779
MVILGGMFGWLASIGYLRANPMALCKIVKNRRFYSERYLSDSLWNDVKCFIEQLPQDTSYYFRCRWLTTLFYLQGMHISEVAKGQMRQFVCLSGPDGNEQWWLKMPSKGGNPRLVPVSLELIEELQRYRKAMGLSSMPCRAEKTPLLLPLGGPRRCLHRSTVHDAIKSVFSNTASWLRSKGPDFEARADQVEKASAHWLRRTAGWDMVGNGVSLQTVRDNLGYESATSAFNLYLYPRSPQVHPLPDDRYNETTRLHKIRWEVANPDTDRTDR